MTGLINQPTSRRLNGSSTTARNNQPSRNKQIKQMANKWGLTRFVSDAQENNRGLDPLCSGTINTVRSAMAAANVDRVHAVLGGFHLAPAPLDYLQHTLQELEAINPDVVLPMHCTGERFIDMLRQRMPEKVVYSNVGSCFSFGA